jgi:quinolinate synthase
MKRITLPKIRLALETMNHAVTIPDALAARARRSVERMIAIG